MAGLSGEELQDYTQARMVWNANLPTVRTTQLDLAYGIIEQVMASGYRDGDRLRGSVVIDAAPGLGKTTIQKLPWGLILIGAFIAVVMELLGLPSLAIAVGTYLPISTSATIFMGGIVRWLVEGRSASSDPPADTSDSGPGVLFSSGLIAGGAIIGVGVAGLQAIRKDEFINITHWMGAGVTSVTENTLVAVAMYVLLLAVPLYRVARRPAP